MKSLKTRLVLTLLVLTLSAWMASAFLTSWFVSRVMLDQVDSQLEQYSGLVNYITRVFSRQLDEGLPLSEPWLQGEYETAHLRPMVIDAPAEVRGPALNIWLENDLIAVMADSPHFDQPSEEGYVLVTLGEGGSQWRILTRYDELTGLWMRLGIELDSARWEMMQMLGRALLPLLLVLPLTVALLYFGVARGLQPLKTLASQIARRSPGVLESVDTAGVPTEMLGVVSSLNELLRRLALALEGEQRFTANAAHELLTPLAAIKTEVQLCQLQLDDERGEAMLARIAQRVDRATHTVEQLLTLARLDPDVPVLAERVDLKSLVEEVLADTAPLAEERKQQVALQADENLVVTGSEQGLTILLRNLLRNAFRYANDGSVIHVALRGPDPVQLEVRNECQALSSEEFARICERFYRVPGSVGQGAGLGLSIVARIAEQHGAELAVGPATTDQGGAGQGFCVRLSFHRVTDLR